MYCKIHGTSGVVKSWQTDYSKGEKLTLVIKCAKCHQEDLKENQKKKETQQFINNFKENVR